MMDNQVTLTSALDALDYSSSPNLILREDSSKVISEELEVIWNDAEEKLEVDAVYFIGNAPVVYFKRFEALEPKVIAEFHRNVWNQCQVPLIVAVLPHDIRVYSGYEAPRPDLIDGLGEPTRLEIEFNPHILPSSSYLWERLRKFTRDALESGSLWRQYSEYFRKETRVDQVLIANLRYVRQELIKVKNLPPEHAHSLIGRSIFALYLQDRGVLSTEEPNFFAEKYNSRYKRYTDLLISYEDTYDFFEFLHNRFDGDMFPVSEEEKNLVDREHLAILRELFTVDRKAGGQMLFFWAYNFKFIPIELISSIYEEFLHQEEHDKNGAYYTPPMLVDFVLNVTLPWTDTNYKLSLLDPACGSGIFLVEAYRRLIERWRKVHKPRPSFKDLSEILTTSIFGVDIKRQALRVAAFSLYLAMLDYLEPKSIWMDVTFPPLIGTNLIVGDFFDKHIAFHEKQFDLIAGNPPWESKLTEHAIDYLNRNSLDIGDKQIVQAFLLHAPDFCTPKGQIALLCSSKSLLFNKSGPNVSFRQRFFRQFNVKAVFDFSVWRRNLFMKAIGPTAAIFYTPQRPVSTATIFYGAPKLTYLARLLSAIVIEANDLKQIPLRQVLDSADSMEYKSDQPLSKQEVLFPDEEDEEEPASRPINIWKVALWGTSYDYILLQTLNNYPSLQEVIDKRDWYSKGGFNRTGPEPGKPCKWLDNALYLDANYFTRYGIDTERLKVLPEGDHYYRGGDARRFKAPLVLFKRGQTQRRPSAAYLDKDCTFTDSITGITGPESERNLLKALTALLNSEFAQYYLFMTAASWGVEREEIKAGELRRTLPFPFLDVSSEQIEAIASLVDRLAELTIISSRYKKPKTKRASKDTQKFFREFVDETKYSTDKEIERLEVSLNDLIYECFHLSEQEIQFIRETVLYTIDFFNSPEKSSAQREPTFEMCQAYAETYIRSINFYLQPIGRRLIATIYYEEGVPLLAIQFSSQMSLADIPEIQITPPNNIRDVLLGLRKLSSEAFGTKMYYRRNFRFYDKATDSLTIAKPPERRLWTTSAALSDAEVTIIEMSQQTQPMRV